MPGATLEDCRILNFPKIYDVHGSLTFIEGGRQVPFDIQRVYYLYDVPGGETRAGHAHMALQQCLIAISGSFDVTLDDGRSRRKYHLNRSYFGLYIPAMVWREIDNFSSGAVCVALASLHYDAGDYIRDYKEYLRIIGGAAS